LKKILVNKEAWQTRVAVLSNDRLQDIYFERTTDHEIERSFFKGRVTKVLPGIQTAFVDIGQAKGGFLHISEIDRALAVEKMTVGMNIDDQKEFEAFERKIKYAMSIEKIFKEGDEILVQVIKEAVSEKGPKLTTCFTLPGKFLVLMPNIPQTGVSKKIDNREERHRLKEEIQKVLPPEMGVIIRTTAENRPPEDLQKDITFLLEIWHSIEKRMKEATVGEKIHADLPIALRTIREHLDDEIEIVICDTEEDVKSIFKFVKHFTPELAQKIRYYQGPPSLFDYFSIDKQINAALNKKVSLKSGGSIVIESTEAMTVIDVNTGKFIGKDSHEDTIFKTNMEAAEEIVYQLRLRNIGGLIVIDFIDLAQHHNRQKLSRFLEKTLKERDKFQSVTLKISEFGLVQMTRKRSGKTLQHRLTQECILCRSKGWSLSTAHCSTVALRQFKEDVVRKSLKNDVLFTLSPAVFHYIMKHEYYAILSLEKELNIKVILEKNESLHEEAFTIKQNKKK
ncbi:Rne/Rng family ribonuclease, partial [Candidatus Babeliales bacterium]|nr:Rne/Rng family ribonuclease [Candidatus Babeliales bacterium]